MLVIPAIDLRNGACVRLRQGEPASTTVYDDDPVARAKAFAAGGARRLHVIDLDAAFGTGDNIETISRICHAVDLPVQTGGGIRSLQRALDLQSCGASEIVLGTPLVEDFALVDRIVRRLSGRVIGAVDARGRRIASRGWQHDGGIDRDAFVAGIARFGIERIIFTDISRDGMRTGFDAAALNAVAAATDCRITASGGAGSMDDVDALARAASSSIDSCIVGTAFYLGTMRTADSSNRASASSKPRP
jgi:phosphoribosylformimino-5-aminoimidazole carboxamide ribotide isomerase